MADLGQSIGARVSYANIISTLALFVALGGASYAAITLPANSVGSRQLRAGAVTSQTLGFPLGARQLVLPTTYPVPESSRCSAGACAVIPRETVLFGHLHLTQPSDLALTALITLDNGDPAGSTSVQLSLFAGGKEVARSSVGVGGERVVPLQAVVSLPAGAVALGIGGTANYGLAEHQVSISEGSIVALTLPDASAPPVVRCSSGRTVLC